MDKTVGVIGLGSIGGNVARVLLEDYPVIVYDIDRDRQDELVDRGAIGASSAAEVGERADVVLLSLPDNDAVRDVTGGDAAVLEGITSQDILIDTSTISPTLSLEVAAMCSERGVGFLDAPVSGGARNAKIGNLTTIVGGSEAVLESARDVLEAISREVYHVGPQGRGIELKVVNNYLFAMNQLLLSEGLMIARAAGIPDETFAEVVQSSSGGSYALDRNMEGFILPDDYDSEFTISLMRKDIEQAERFASERGVTFLVGGESGLFRLAEEMGYGELDSSAIVKLFEDVQQPTE